MNTVHKFTVPFTGAPFTVSLREDAEVLTAQMQKDQMSFWVALDTDKPVADRTFFVSGTGREFPPFNKLKYIATVQDDGNVWHMFEEIVP